MKQIFPIVVLSCFFIGCDDGKPDPTPTPIPETIAMNVPEQTRFEPEYALRLLDNAVEWSARVNTGGWTMKSDRVLIDEVDQKQTARIYVILEEPGSDEMVTQAFETLTGRHDAPNLGAAELSVRRVVRGENSSAQTFVVVKRVP